jgi:hypothetical protein
MCGSAFPILAVIIANSVAINAIMKLRQSLPIIDRRGLRARAVHTSNSPRERHALSLRCALALQMMNRCHAACLHVVYRLFHNLLSRVAWHQSQHFQESASPGGRRRQ